MPPGASGQGCIRREGTSEAAPETVGQAVGGGCQSGWGRLLSVTNAIEGDVSRQGDRGWAWAGRPGGRGFQCIPASGSWLAGEDSRGHKENDGAKRSKAVGRLGGR